MITNENAKLKIIFIKNSNRTAACINKCDDVMMGHIKLNTFDSDFFSNIFFMPLDCHEVVKINVHVSIIL